MNVFMAQLELPHGDRSGDFLRERGWSVPPIPPPARVSIEEFERDCRESFSPSAELKP